MKKDFELIKRILKAVEDHEGPGESGMDRETLELSDIAEDIYYFHTKLLSKEGLIESEKEVWINDEYPRYLPIALTSTGRDFLFESSDKAKWDKTRAFLLNTGKDLAVAVVAEYLKKCTLP